MNEQTETTETTEALGPHDTEHAKFLGMVEVDGELMAHYRLDFEL